jgi:hypothetical protein
MVVTRALAQPSWRLAEVLVHLAQLLNKLVVLVVDQIQVAPLVRQVLQAREI